MMLEAVWFKGSKEVYCISPVMNIVCYNNMEDVTEIEINDGRNWYTYEDIGVDADDFMIRTKRD
jgi:hypothetical protein